ncbi:hypothetical protein [Streptomyces sp. NPDC001054]
MNRKEAAGVDLGALIGQLATAIEALTRQAGTAELRCYTPAEAGDLLGKTENWVVEAIQARRIPFTYVGRSPRLTAAHIRWVQSDGELMPSRTRRLAAA